jgi:hypothetical protein
VPQRAVPACGNHCAASPGWLDAFGLHRREASRCGLTHWFRPMKFGAVAIDYDGATGMGEAENDHDLIAFVRPLQFSRSDVCAYSALR